MKRLYLFLFSLIIPVFFSCSLFDSNLLPAIDLNFNGEPVNFYIYPVDNQITLTIKSEDIDGIITSVKLKIEDRSIDITDMDNNERDDIFTGSYRIDNRNKEENCDISIIVQDDKYGESMREVSIDNTGFYGIPKSDFFDIIIPEIEIPDGGLLFNPAPSGETKYHNSDETKEESDVQIEEPAYRNMYAKRYLHVSGIAVPDDAGYSDRGYHAVLFSLNKDSKTWYYTFPVNNDNRFSGYLYFPEYGKYTIYSYRIWDNHLYPHETTGKASSVSEGATTLSFTVTVTEPVPDVYHHLLPTRDVDCGIKYLREYASSITEGYSSDMEKVKAIYEFFMFGDEKGTFRYNYYSDIYPGFLDKSYIDVFLASHFLLQRKGVCNDFAECFAALTRALGFKVKKVYGFVPGGAGHMWNLIYIDSRWYRLDTTFAVCTGSYERYAEFYDAFDAVGFESSHEDRYTEGFTVEY